jgi:hypothetical protein
LTRPMASAKRSGRSPAAAMVGLSIRLGMDIVNIAHCRTARTAPFGRLRGAGFPGWKAGRRWHAQIRRTDGGTACVRLKACAASGYGIGAYYLAFPLRRLAMHQAGGERGNAYRDVLGAAGFR